MFVRNSRGKNNLDSSKLKRIKALEKLKYVSLLMILVPIVIFAILFNTLFQDRKSLTSEEFQSILGFFGIIFSIFIGYSIVLAFVLYKSIFKSIIQIKKENLWNNYGQHSLHIEPTILVLSFIPLFSGSIDFLYFLIFNNMEYLIFGIIDLIFFSSLIALFFYLSKIEKKYDNYEITNLGKIKFNDSKMHIEKVLNKNNLQYKRLGPKKEIFLKSDETYLLDNNFELLIRSTNKENVNKFLWPESMRFTSIIMGKINKKNIQLVRKIQKEIDKLKKE